MTPDEALRVLSEQPGAMIPGTERHRALEIVVTTLDEARAALARRDTTIAAVRDLADDLPDLLQTYAWSHQDGTWLGYAEFVADRIRAALSAPVEAGTPADADPQPVSQEFIDRLRSTTAREPSPETAAAIERWYAELDGEEAGTPAAEPAPDGVVIDAMAWYCTGCGAPRHNSSGSVTQTHCTGCGESGVTGRGVGRALTGVGAPTDPADNATREAWGPLPDIDSPALDDETGVVIGRFLDATDQHGDRVMELWDDDVHRTRGGASNHYVEHVDDERGGWEVYELHRLPNPRAALAGPADDTTREAQP